MDDFTAKLRAHRAHMAAVPVALEVARTAVVDLHGQPIADAESPRSCLTCAQLRTLVAEVDRLAALVKQQQKDAIEADREFSREARDIAAEATWQERERNNEGGY